MNHGVVRRFWCSRWPLAGLAALAMCLPLGACATTSSTATASGDGRSASAMQHPTLEGIPIPAGFELVGDRSFHHASGRLRYANCEFQGDGDPAAVERFYRKHMPSAGFTLRQTSSGRGEYVLEFDSSNERSTVRARRDKFKTILIVTVSPTPKGSVEREANPPLRNP